jgi:hypothetical protein
MLDFAYICKGGIYATLGNSVFSFETKNVVVEVLSKSSLGGHYALRIIAPREPYNKY